MSVISEAMATLERLEKAHEGLLTAVQDWLNMPLSEGARDRLATAIKASEKLQNDLEN